jgi:hypothetical protein
MGPTTYIVILDAGPAMSAMEPKLHEFEIGENVLIRDIEVTARNPTALMTLGVRVSIGKTLGPTILARPAMKFRSFISIGRQRIAIEYG